MKITTATANPLVRNATIALLCAEAKLAAAQTLATSAASATPAVAAALAPAVKAMLDDASSQMSSLHSALGAVRDAVAASPTDEDDVEPFDGGTEPKHG